MKLYKSYYLHSVNEITESGIEEIKYGFKVYFSKKLDCNVAEAINEKQETLWVLYYTNLLTKDIKEYHQTTYADILLALCDELKNGVKIIFFKNFEINKYSIETYFNNGKPKLRQEFNENFELVEYCQCIYDADGILIKEKFFYADSWAIHTEKMI